MAKNVNIFVCMRVCICNLLVGNRSTACTCCLTDMSSLRTAAAARGQAFRFLPLNPFCLRSPLLSLTCLLLSLSVLLPTLSRWLCLCGLSLSLSCCVFLSLSLCTALTVSRGSCLHSFTPRSSCSML